MHSENVNDHLRAILAHHTNALVSGVIASVGERCVSLCRLPIRLKV